ncbi:MAG TPA: CocE/NonD family hydrolase [Nevskiaceae bacterium]|nr:CocE/NonD family hydrolase [Nevskiaceae bacterium]
MLRALPLLLSTLLLVACGSSSDSAPAGEIISEITRDGEVRDVVLASDVDGEAIAFTVIEPETVVEGARYPLVLHSHGYGGSRQATRPTSGLLAELSAAGYGLISIDERGHGDSGGTIRILDPELEGRDLLQIVDWAEANLDWLAYRNGNLILGATGGSYGGGFQHLIYALDPQRRLDAIVPEITWHDLRYSLFQGGVFKSFWASVLSAAGNAAGGGGRQDAEVNEGLVQGLTMNNLDEEKLALLRRHSLISYCEEGRLTPIDALYWQSAEDTLFNLNDAVNNYRCVSAQGGDVRLLTKTGGHDSLVGGGSGEQCGRLDKNQSILDWFDEKLKGLPGRASYIPELCWHLASGGEDGVVTSRLPEISQTVQLPAQNLLLQEGTQAAALSQPLFTVAAGGAVLAGIPRLDLTVSDPAGLEAGDPIVFAALAIRRAGSSTDTLLHPNQVAPVRGYGAFSLDLVGGMARLNEGDELRLLLYPSFLPRYVNSGTRVATPVTVAATVGLPLLPGDLPQAPANP